MGHRFDGIVLTSGTQEALDLLPITEWEARLTSALAELHAFAGTATSIIVAGIPRNLSSRGLPPRLARAVEQHAADLDRSTAALCATWAGTAFVPLAAVGEVAGSATRAAQDYQQWAEQIAAELSCRLGGVDDDVDELRRQSAVDHLGLTDSGADLRLRRIVEMARRAFGTETALFTVLDRDLQLHVARSGTDTTRLPRVHSFCQFTILDRDGMIIEDARDDERFRDNPHVLGEPHVRFYAGFPVNSPDGERIGALCVFDSSPRRRDDVNMSLLRELAYLLQDVLWSYHAEAAARR